MPSPLAKTLWTSFASTERRSWGNWMLDNSVTRFLNSPYSAIVDTDRAASRNVVAASDVGAITIAPPFRPPAAFITDAIVTGFKRPPRKDRHLVSISRSLKRSASRRDHSTQIAKPSSELLYWCEIAMPTLAHSA